MQRIRVTRQGADREAGIGNQLPVLLKVTRFLQAIEVEMVAARPAAGAELERFDTVERLDLLQHSRRIESGEHRREHPEFHRAAPNHLGSPHRCPDAAPGMALEHGVDETGHAVAILERRHRRRTRLAAIHDAGVDVAHDVGEGIRPCLLMSAGQVSVSRGRGRQQRGIFRQRHVGLIAPADPEFVLLLLPPSQRRGRAVDLEPEIVLVSGAHLADADHSLRAAVEAHEDGGEILARHRVVIALGG